MLLQSGSSLDAPTLNELNGLCKPVKYFKSSKNFKNNNIYGVLPFIAPEVLRGQPYTLSSDIFSFSMIMWEFISGILPFNNEAYNFQLSLDINKGKRPEIIEDTPQCYINLMKRCWDMNSLKRPTALEIYQNNLYEIIDKNNLLEIIDQEKYFHNYKNLEFNNIQKIGGVFTTVYCARWKYNDNFVILKSFNNFNNRIIEEIKNELKLQQRIKYHPNIIQFYGITSINIDKISKYALVLEYADSGTLNSYLNEHIKILDWNEKVKLAHQIANAILYLHKNNVVHCDLNTENIYIHQKNIKLASLGLSKTFNKKSKISGPYMDPKSIKNTNYRLNKKSDVYSFGVLMWQISSGCRPYYDEDEDNIIKERRDEIIPDTPIEYKCREYEPSERPNMQEIVLSLDQFILDQLQSSEINIEFDNLQKDNAIIWIPYVDPEKLKDLNFQYEKASDIYSYGVLMWEISSGFSPFKNLTSQNDQALLRIRISGGHREDDIEDEVEMSESDNEPENDLPLDDL
ncbi:17742_t:CDS:2 [Funneliformis geosporum]|nr:17742_t:CDS:2 [Funneliformis geosporum]